MLDESVVFEMIEIFGSSFSEILMFSLYLYLAFLENLSHWRQYLKKREVNRFIRQPLFPMILIKDFAFAPITITPII